LGGDGIISESGVRNAECGMEGQPYTGKREEGFADLKRAGVPTIPVSERHDGFLEVDLCFNDDQAIKEANRCLQCDLEISLAQRLAN
ncbi:MAG: hypothetical protein U9N82_01340, partial [Thermodesulfobacteriota bacterium]|nr:hypothetical protein [Thermodesulfobacteriota bacterium]